jgi:hypothetical protein
VKELQKDVDEAPVEGKSLVSVAGLTALVVEAHSPDDVDQANPAFMRFVLGDVEVQVSGGESLDDLIRIATTIIDDRDGSLGGSLGGLLA